MAQRQVVMVTGASAGVGRAVAERFGRRGAAVGLFARGRAGLEGASEAVRRLGGEPLVLQGDVADADRVEEAAAELEQRVGPIDVWVNNAMVSVFSPVKEMTPEEFRRVTDVTYHGVVHGTLSALRRMLPRNRGTIVQVGSALAYRGIPLQSAYCAAKHAIQGFCDSLWSELLHDGSRVRMTMVHLPAVNTPQFDWVKSRLSGRAQPVPPIFTPELAADAIVWASDHPRRELMVGFPTVRAIVGDKIVPAVGDWYLARNGFEAQQTDEPEEPGRPHNLWTPVDEDRDFGAHGRFGDRSASTSWQLWLTRNRGPLAAVAAAAAAAWAIAAAGRTGPAASRQRTSRHAGTAIRQPGTAGSARPAAAEEVTPDSRWA